MRMETLPFLPDPTKPVFYHPETKKPVLLVSFSGGQTSGYLAKEIKSRYGNLYHIVFMFANTGCENNETLDFVHACDVAFNLNVVWVEAVINPEHGKGVTHRVTNYQDAFRSDQYQHPDHPFHAHIRKSGIPNSNKPQCSDRIKAFAIEDFKRTHGYQGQPHAIGIRADESKRIMSKMLCTLIEKCGESPDRWRKTNAHEKRMEIIEKAILLSDKQKGQIETFSNKLRHYGLIYPLTDTFPVGKTEINAFWDKQAFRLDLEEHEGNCQTCWKKSDRKLSLLALEHPERFDAFDYWEKTYQHVKPNNDGTPRVFFRKNRSAKQMLEQAKLFNPNHIRRLIGADTYDKSDGEDGCSESCESYNLNLFEDMV